MRVTGVRNVPRYSPGSDTRFRESVTLPPILYHAGQFARWCVYHPIETLSVTAGLWVTTRFGSAPAGAAASLSILLLGAAVWTIPILRLARTGRASPRLILLGAWRKLLTTRRWPSVAERLRLVTNRSGRPLKLRIVGITTTGVTASLVSGPAGVTADEIANRADNLAALFDCRRVTVRPGPKPSITLLDIAYGDPLAAELRLDQLPQAGRGLAAYGLTESGEPATVRYDLPLLVVGMSGAGKSSLIWALLASLVRDRIPTRIRVMDTKGGMELSAFRDEAHEYAVTEKDCMTLLRNSVAALEARTRDYGARNIRKHKPTEDEPLDILIIDELLDLTMSLDPAVVKEAKGHLAKLLRLGRAVGFWTVAGSQAGTIDVISRLRTFFPQRIAMATEGRDQTDAVLGDTATASGATAHKISARTPGIGYAFNEGHRGFARFRAVHVYDGEAAQIAAGKPPDLLPESLLEAEGERPNYLYRYYDAAGQLLYVGISVNPVIRADQHTDKPWWEEYGNGGYSRCEGPFATRAEVEEAEKAAIKAEGPLYNIAHNGNRRRLVRPAASAEDTQPLDREAS